MVVLHYKTLLTAQFLHTMHILKCTFLRIHNCLHMDSLGNSGTTVVSDVNLLIAISCMVKETDQHLRQNNF